MSEVIKLLNARIAGRAISDEKLSEETIGDLIQAARLTPSCFNNQPWRFLFITSEEGLKKGTDLLAPPNAAWASTAPLLIIGYTKAEDDCNLPDGRSYHQFDLGMSVMNLMLAATEKGLVARPMAGFSPRKVKEHFNLNDDQQPMVAIAVGYPSDDESHLPEEKQGLGDKPRERKEVGEIVVKV